MKSLDMDISNEVSIDLFPIGPTTIVGRAIAFRVLFCKSMAHFRHQLAAMLFKSIHRFGDIAAPLFSWLHPRNPQGILVLVTLIAFVLKRYTSVQSRAELAYKRKFWRNMMRAAVTYEEWAHAARMLEREGPRMNESECYDEELVRNKLQELWQRRQEGSIRDIMFCMRADLIRNLGNMCNPELHRERLQVPRLIKDYIDEVTTQLRMVCESKSEELLLEEKLAFMHETRHAFGRTALLLSGGASLGAFHIGVVKTLVDHKLLPRVIAGSSVGSIMCSIAATRSWPELQRFFDDSWRSLKFFDQMGGIFTVVKRIMTFGAVHEIRHLQVLLRQLTSNLTFQEAYDMTGRILAITVCSPRKHEPPRCLNYLTSPHVVIWSAVTASCAFPGLFEAQELMAKDRYGKIVPYHPPFHLGPEEGRTPSRRWRDGSLESDLPMMHLKELFNVNHFIVSQANPHIAPLLRLKAIIRTYGGKFAAKLAELTEMEVKHRCNQILALGFPLGGLAKLFAQEWEGHVTVVMPATLAQYYKIIQNPSKLELQKAANQGRRCTWEKLSAMKANCAIELALDECVALLNHMRKHKRSTERAAAVAASYTQPPITGRFNASKRIPSWNCIARENSAGSLDELASSQLGASSGQNQSTGHGIPDGSDSESETVDHSTWTRSGGPLMRTASAAKFVDFLQSLDLGPAMSRSLAGQLNSAVMQTVSRDHTSQSPSVATPDRCSENNDYEQRNSSLRSPTSNASITVTEGDILHPEMTPNGIVLNVLKPGDLLIPTTSNDSDGHRESLSPGAECVQLDCPDREIDTSSTSDYADDDDNAPRNLLEEVDASPDQPTTLTRDNAGIAEHEPETT